jgi:NTE family protein
VQILRNTVAFYETSRQVTLFNLNQRGGTVDLGTQFEDWGELRAGVYRGKVQADVGAGAANVTPGSIGTGGFQSRFTIARSDSPSIPTSGFETQFTYLNSQKGMGATDAYSKFEGGGYTVYTYRRQSFMLGLSGGSNINTVIPAYDEFALGGLLNLSGFAPGQIRGQRYALFRLGTYTRIHMLPSQIGEGVYAGVFAEMGDAWSEHRDWHHSLMLITGADTVIGPVFVAYARGDSSTQRFYVAIGKRF